MKLNSLRPKIEKTIEFDYSKQKFIPETYGCYVITNFDFDIMYIGKATSLKNRFTSHLEDSEKNLLTKLGKAYWFCFKYCKNEHEIARLERGWLNSFELENGELPIFNKIRA